MLRPDGRLAVGLLLAAAVVVSTLVMAATTGQSASAKPMPTPVSPAIKTSTLAPDDQAASFAYYKALRTCLIRQFSYRNAGGLALPNSMSQQNAIDFDWFKEGNVYAFTTNLPLPLTPNSVNVGVINDPRTPQGDGVQYCGGSEGKAWIAKAAGLWGYKGPELLCALGFKRDLPDNCTVVTPYTNDFIAPVVPDPLNILTTTPTTLALDALWKDTLGNGSRWGSIRSPRWVALTGCITTASSPSASRAHRARAASTRFKSSPRRR